MEFNFPRFNNKEARVTAAAFLVAMMLVGILAGCSGNSGSPTGPQEKEPSVELPDTSQTDTTKTSENSDTTSSSNFVVFDGTRFRNKPEMTQYGFEKIEVIYANRLWKEEMDQIGPWELPSKELVYDQAFMAKEVNSEITVLDIEHWPNHGDNADVERAIENYTTVLEWFQTAVPGMKVGYWDTLPVKKRYMSDPPVPKYYEQWQESNDRLIPLADKVDVFYPQLYTYSRDQEQWVVNAKYMIQEARRYSGDKPVYVFLWPQYYGIDNLELKDEYIQADYWQLQLDTARKYADGIVIWFPWEVSWEEASQAPWWKVTKEFIQEVKANSSASG